MIHWIKIWQNNDTTKSWLHWRGSRTGALLRLLLNRVPHDSFCTLFDIFCKVNDTDLQISNYLSCPNFNDSKINLSSQWYVKVLFLGLPWRKFLLKTKVQERQYSNQWMMLFWLTRSRLRRPQKTETNKAKPALLSTLRDNHKNDSIKF
jgi:hypothetical protein